MDYVSGGISGAITNIHTQEAQLHAISAYEAIRNDKHDIEKIAKNTGNDIFKIELIKRYLFHQKHKKYDGSMGRFDANFYIAQSWHRLAYEPENIQPHDLLLLDHESMEMTLGLQGKSQEEAHKETDKVYNYNQAATAYYNKLRETQKRHPSETPITLKLSEQLVKLQEESEAREDDREKRTFDKMVQDKLNRIKGGAR